MNLCLVFSHVIAQAAWLDKQDYPVVKYPDAGHFVSEIRPADLSNEIRRL